MRSVSLTPWSGACAGCPRLVLILAATALIAGALVSRAAAQPPATILYVDADATGAGDGISWADAYVYLQDAFDQANVADDPALEIWVAAGVYYPDVDANGDHVPGSRAESFTLARDGVRLYGGFDPGSGVTTFDQRDPAAYPTVLSGDVDRNDVDADGNGVAETWVDVQGANAYHVLYLDGRAPHSITDATVVEGLIVTAGQADGVYPEDQGGGLWCRAGRTPGPIDDAGICSPTLVGLVLRGNQATKGGGMSAEGREGGVSNPTVEDVLFAGNRATEQGGGMHNSTLLSTMRPTLRRVTFDGNEASSGGGMANLAYMGETSPVIYDTLFEQNRAGIGGGLYNYPDLSASHPLLIGVTFRENEATVSSGGMHYYSYSGDGGPALIDVSFERNTAGANGGGLGVVSIYGGATDTTLIGVTFQGNVAATGGGGMSVQKYGSRVNSSLTNVLFSGNQAGSDGGGIENVGDTATLINVTFAANWAAGRGGALANGVFDTGDPNAILINGILWGNGAGGGDPEIYDGEDGSTVETSIVAGGFPRGTGILDVDPLFARPPSPGADGTWGTADDDYGDLSLQAASPAVDAGDDSALPADSYDVDGDGDLAEPMPIDLAGSTRLVGPVDLGAYEMAGADVEIAVETPVIEAMPGALVTYDLTFTNHGPQTASGIVVSDSLSLDYLSDVAYDATLPVTPVRGLDSTWHVASLAPGAGGTITVQGVLSQCLAGGTVLSGSATIRAAEMDPLADNNADEVGLTVLNAPPVAHDDVYTTSTGVLSVTADLGVLHNDVDANCEALSAVLVQDVDRGTLRLDASGSLVYTAPVAFYGTATFVYQATDGQHTSPPATVRITGGTAPVIHRIYLPLVARK